MPAMEYSKPWQGYKDRLDLLILRGLAVTNPLRNVDTFRRIYGQQP